MKPTFKVRAPAVFLPVAQEGVEFCIPSGSYDEYSKLIRGKRHIEVTLAKKNLGKVLKHSDAPWLLSGSLVFRSSAVSALGAVLKKFGKLLSLESSDPDLSIYYCTEESDRAFNLERSEVDWISGAISRVRRYAFNEDAIAGLDLFKITQIDPSPIFVSAEFVRLWRKSGLKGLTFKEVWRG